MIATVRIAPVERWCDYYRPPKGYEAVAEKLVGMPIHIQPSSMRQAHCDPEARMWDAADESLKAIEEILGHPAPNQAAKALCEHVLEMD